MREGRGLLGPSHVGPKKDWCVSVKEDSALQPFVENYYLKTGKSM
jgi:hypothetical protein